MAIDRLAELGARAPRLVPCLGQIQLAADLLADCLAADRTLFLAGNGGSAADCEHWAGELLKGFEHPRPAPEPDLAALRLQRGLRAIPLTGFLSARTAAANDIDPTLDFAQVLYALGRPGDVLIGLSTSGEAANVRACATVARARGLRILALTGERGGRLAAAADVAIRVPATRTLEVQELHLPVYHTLSLMLEDRFFRTGDAGSGQRMNTA